MRCFATTLAATAAVGFAFAASAADLPVKMPAAPAQGYNWTGCYLGAQAGGGTMRDTYADVQGEGAIAGGQVGCNYQTGILVVGVEGEGFWSGLTSVWHGSFPAPGGTIFNDEYWARNKADADVAGRVGFAFDRALIYGKAGWAWGWFSWGYTDNTGGIVTGSSTLDGLLIGAGLEYGITQNWSAKFEYDNVNFAARNVYFAYFCPTCFPTNQSYSASRSAEKQIFKLGLNYRF